LGRKEKHDIEKELREWFRGAGRVVVVGVGNPIRMDDFVGVKIVRDLRGKVDSSRVMLIEAETIPENHMQEIIDYKPTHILIIDAAIMGSKAGDVRLVKHEKLTNFAVFSTHALPLRLFCEYATDTAKARIRLLLIQPTSADFGEGLSPIVEETGKHVAALLLGLLPARSAD
jgi:hydrogenase 3 maturation protease